MASSNKPSPEGVAATAIERRKAEHLRIAAEEDIETKRAPGWDDVHLVHDALPELALDEVVLQTRILGKTLRAPIVIASMTGGTDEAARVNRALASLAEERGYGFGLGSQRAMMAAPATLYFQPTILPSDRVAAMVSR